MTETTINYEEFAAEYITAMKESNTAVLEELPKTLKTEAEKSEGLSALLEAFDKENDEFKDTHSGLIEALKATKEAQAQLEAAAVEDSSDSATEEKEAEASEPTAEAEVE